MIVQSSLLTAARAPHDCASHALVVRHSFVKRTAYDPPYTPNLTEIRLLLVSENRPKIKRFARGAHGNIRAVSPYENPWCYDVSMLDANMSRPEVIGVIRFPLFCMRPLTLPNAAWDSILVCRSWLRLSSSFMLTAVTLHIFQAGSSYPFRAAFRVSS